MTSGGYPLWKMIASSALLPDRIACDIFMIWRLSEQAQRRVENLLRSVHRPIKGGFTDKGIVNVMRRLN